MIGTAQLCQKFGISTTLGEILSMRSKTYRALVEALLALEEKAQAQATTKQ